MPAIPPARRAPGWLRCACLGLPLPGTGLLLRACLCLLWPLLVLQGRQVRRRTPRLPEAPGRRAGTSGTGPRVRLLVAGDSGAAGVGAASQDEALCGHLVRCLGRHHTVDWCVWAVNGLDSPGLLQLLQDAPGARFDVVVLSMGANDATRLCAPSTWARWQARLAALIDLRFAPDLLVHSAVPPMHACRALPQPLRWFMGSWARQMNLQLAATLIGQGRRTLQGHPDSTTRTGMAADGIHPSAAGYAVWAEALSRSILAARAPVGAACHPATFVDAQTARRQPPRISAQRRPSP